MSVENRFEYAEMCFRGEPPPCVPACPFGLNVAGLNKKLQKRRFDAAYVEYRDAVIFPAIVCRLCHMPCAEACVRKHVDDSVNMRYLERAATVLAKKTAPRKLGLPSKDKSAAVIGAGICGLSCALILATHGNKVTIYEKENRIGGRLWEQLPEDVFLSEIHNQMQFLKYELVLNTEITNVHELLERYDAVLIATGRNGKNFSLKEGLNQESLGTTKDGIFLAGGAAESLNSVVSIEHGIRAAQSMESYMQIGRMHEMAFVKQAKTTKLRINTDTLIPQPSEIPNGYTTEDAEREACRCLLCDCEACRLGCDMMQWFRQVPQSIVADTNDALRLTKDTRVYGPQPLGNLTKRMISSCNDCGYCGAACPESIDVGTFLMEARRLMHQRGTLPEVFHEFWMQDMEFSLGDDVFLAKNAPGYDTSDYVFFPGCQLGASDPRYVVETYAYLLKTHPCTGLLLSCCGIPAEWAGDEKTFKSVNQRNLSEWERMGKPTIIFACPTCKKSLAEHFPEAKIISVYNILDDKHSGLRTPDNGETVAVFDPCSSRDDEEMQRAVRSLLNKSGFNVEELPYHGNTARCCGHGGNIYTANPDLVNSTVKKRINASDFPYVTYCTNCRDIFADNGKPCYHILDILFNINKDPRQPPTLSQRRTNRVLGKKMVQEHIWKEVMEPVLESGARLIISPEIYNKMNKNLILTEDVERIIEYCETTHSKLYMADLDRYVGHLKYGHTTCWVVYKPKGDKFEIIDVYSHRIAVEGE